MAIAQGLYKTLAYKKQAGIGVAASGAGGQQLRRESASFNLMKDTYDANEIVSHQQDTGVAYGDSKTAGDVSGVMSAGTYAPLLASLCRTTLVAGVAITGLTLTIAVGGAGFNITRSAGSFLADGVKIGDIVRITAGTYTGVARDINLVVANVQALFINVDVPNGKALTVQTAVASSTLTVINKKAVVPSTGQANDYYTFEEWYSDLARSRTYIDTQVASADISIPATGNSTIKLSLVGLSRAKAATQAFTTPAAATTTAVLAGANAFILLNGAQSVIGTSLSVKIDGQVTPGESTIGSRTITDNTKGELKVTGSVTLLHQSETTSDLFVNETTIGIVAVLFADNTDNSDFVSINIPAVKLTKDDIDDGKKQLVMSSDFIGQYNGSGGAALSQDTGIVSIQDSAA